MSSLVFLIEQIANGLYALCAVGLLFGLRGWLSARHSLSLAEYELERELAEQSQAGAITRSLAFIEVALAVVAISHVIAPTLRADLLPAAQGIAISSGSFKTVVPNQATVINDQGTPVVANDVNAPFLTLTAAPADANVKIAATATISPTPVGTIQPGAPLPSGCLSDEAQLQSPANGEILFESLTVIGSAHTANFARYKFEISGPSTGNTFAPYGGDKQIAVPTSGVLGQLSLTPFAYGTYRFRLTVFDSTSQLKAACTVTVYIQPRPPTLTPSNTPPPSPTATVSA